MQNDNEAFQTISQPQQYQFRGLRHHQDPNYSDISCLNRSPANAMSLFAKRCGNLRLQRSSSGE